MGILDWSQCPAVESIPGKVSGAWLFKDTRTPVSVVFENLKAGASVPEIMDWFHLSNEQVIAVLDFVVRSLDVPLSPQQFDAQLKTDLDTGRIDDRIDRALNDHMAGNTQPV